MISHVPNTPGPQWLCAQQGAREHYAIPRALALHRALRRLITDIWIDGAGWARRIPSSILRKVVGRSHAELPRELVTSCNATFFRMDLRHRFRRESDEAFFTARNERFDAASCQILQAELAQSETLKPAIAFAYAHGCRRFFKRAKSEGLATVLGQFDPGPSEAEIVDQEHAEHPEFRTTWQRYSEAYVGIWCEEVAHADKIVVNSEWSKSCLTQFGTPAERIQVVPLVYSGSLSPIARRYPKSFDRGRPLRVLFLGQVILRKGIARLIRAAELLRNEPIEIQLVGPTDIQNLGELCRGLHVRYSGPAPRSDVERFYDQADVFILPTLSDGFAITLIEAQSRRLPVITTTRCGQVIQDGVNGVVLEFPTGEIIASTLRAMLANPESLAAMSERSSVEGFRLESLATALNAIGEKATLESQCAR
jgi:glycosyltransferase involved in cell wall biosynthesis